MTRIIIQPGRYRGLHQIIHLQYCRFLMFKWWKTISICEYDEHIAGKKLLELIRRYNVKLHAVYDWSENGCYRNFLREAV